MKKHHPSTFYVWRECNPNRGHGWVNARPDGGKARCGGPSRCGICQCEKKL